MARPEEAGGEAVVHDHGGRRRGGRVRFARLEASRHGAVGEGGGELEAERREASAWLRTACIDGGRDGSGGRDASAGGRESSS